MRFVAKIEKIAYTRNAKHSNRHNFISVQDIDTNFVCIVGFSGSAIWNMQKWAKIEQNILS